MSEPFLIIRVFSENNPDLVTWGVAGIILLFGLLLQITEIKEYIAEWKLTHLLINAGSDVLHNVTIPDGMDGNIFIEYLILTPKKIILLGVKKYRGLIFAASKIDLWTQVIGNKSYKFNNPLLQLENDALALRSKIENITIEEKVLFIKGSEFPKGKPDNVISVDDVVKWKQEGVGDIPIILTAAWDELASLATSNDHARGVLIDKDHSSGVNIFHLVVFVVVLSLWLTWRLAY